MAGPYGQPLHPLAVSVPIGAWTGSLIFDIGSRVTGGSAGLARGSFWLIAIGLAGALAAALLGFLDLIAIPLGTRAARTAVLHMSLVLLVTAAYAGNLLWRHAEVAAGKVPLGPLALSAASMAVLGAGGYLGGKLVFRYGVRVAEESDRADGYQLPASGRAAEPRPPAAAERGRAPRPR
ncbi:MAG TPA: DUF2231 domain-containing protein [Streptosporangiaceae bacterium]